MEVSLYSVKLWNLYTNRQLESSVLTTTLKGLNKVDLTLQQRITKLEELIKQCSIEADKLATSESDTDAKLYKNVLQLQARACCFLKTIFDVNSNKNLIMQLKLNKLNPKLITTQNFNKKKKGNKLLTNEFSLFDKKYGVKYLNKIEREKHRIIFSDGKFYKIAFEGSICKTIKLEPFCTIGRAFKGAYGHDEKDKAIITIDKRGNIFEGNTRGKYFHHSSFIAGKKVYFAGSLKTNNKGELLEIINLSGHYKPNGKKLLSTTKMFYERGIVGKKTKIYSFNKQKTDKHYKRTGKDKIFFKKMSFSKIKYKKTQYRQGALGRLLWTRKKWRTKTDSGFFIKRNGLLKNTDKLLQKYIKQRKISRPSDNVKVLDQILTNIERIEKRSNSFNCFYRKLTSTDKRIKKAAKKLRSQIKHEKYYWDNVTKEIDPSNLTFRRN